MLQGTGTYWSLTMTFRYLPSPALGHAVLYGTWYAWSFTRVCLCLLMFGVACVR